MSTRARRLLNPVNIQPDTLLTREHLAMMREEAGLGVCSDTRKEFGRDYRILALLNLVDQLRQVD